MHSKTVSDETLHHPRSFRITFDGWMILAIILLQSGCQSPTSLKIAFLGDINLGRDVSPTLGTFSYLEEYLSGSDLVLANLESPLGTKKTNTQPGYNLCAPVEHAFLLAEWGFDLLSLANNHSLDCSPTGITHTQNTLEAAGLIGLTRQPYAVDIKGSNIIIFALDDIATELDIESATKAITAAHSHGSVIIVSMHWGMEYQGAPSDRQKHLAGVLSEAGADIIWGHHPHVLQPVEWMETSRGHSVVFYSLGNALFDQGGLEDTRQSALLMVEIINGEVKSIEAVPFEIDVPESVLIQPPEEASMEIFSRLAIPDGLLTTR